MTHSWEKYGTGGRTDRQTDRQTERQTDRQTDNIQRLFYRTLHRAGAQKGKEDIDKCLRIRQVNLKIKDNWNSLWQNEADGSVNNLFIKWVCKIWFSNKKSFFKNFGSIEPIQLK